MSIEQHIEVKRTARFHTYGNLSEKTEHLIFAIHGYGELAGRFIRPFEQLDGERFFVVAPEGLNRFYWHSASRPPVATWMTSTDRLNEIKDYVNYLNQLYNQITAQIPSNAHPKIHVLGFSQGVATITRWLADGKAKADTMILWAGKIAHDLDWREAQSIFQRMNIYLIYGLQDKYIGYLNIDNYLQLLEEKELAHQVMTFEGDHVIDLATLKKLVEKL